MHVLFNECGALAAGEFLGLVQRVVNYWLLSHSFTVGVGDTIADKATLNEVKEIIDEAKKKVGELVKQGQNGTLQLQPGATMLQSFEQLVRVKMNQAVGDAAAANSKLNSENNGFKCTVAAGSKGSNINISQIMGVVGQQNVESQRIPYGFKNRTLPHLQR